MVEYFCHHLSDSYVDTPVINVHLSDHYVKLTENNPDRSSENLLFIHVFFRDYHLLVNLTSNKSTYFSDKST